MAKLVPRPCIKAFLHRPRYCFHRAPLLLVKCTQIHAYLTSNRPICPRDQVAWAVSEYIHKLVPSIGTFEQLSKDRQIQKYFNSVIKGNKKPNGIEKPMTSSREYQPHPPISFAYSMFKKQRRDRQRSCQT